MLWALSPIRDSFPGLLCFYLKVVLAWFGCSLPNPSQMARWFSFFLTKWIWLLPKGKRNKWDLKFPYSPSCGAQLQCILFSIRMVQLQSWELQVERRAKTRQKWSFLFADNFLFLLVITVCSVEFESKSKSRLTYFNRVFSFHVFFNSISKFLFSKTLTSDALSQHRLDNSNPQV